jgi:hypothetical protein
MHNSNNLITKISFPLHDSILFQGHGKYQVQDLQLGVLEYKIYRNAVMNTKYHDFDRLRPLHELDKTEEDKDMTWNCCKAVDCCKKGDVNSSNHKCLVECNDINKTKSWVNYFALNLSNPKLNISFVKNNNPLGKMPLCHLTQFCRSNTAVDIVRILKISISPGDIKYKLSIQIPKGIKNAIELHKKNANKLWQEAIKIELKQLSKYQTYIVLDSGEDIPTGYQKIPYHIVFMSNII